MVRDKAPTAQETFAQMAQAAGLRGRILLTLGLMILVRLGTFLPLPGIDRAAFAASIAGSPLVGFLNIFSGIATLGIFALGILPYINASIILQLLTQALPALENLQKNEGEAGRRKIAQITRLVSLGWAIVQSIGIALWVRPYVTDFSPFFIVQTVLALTAGSMFVMWVGEVITEQGIGNGASLLIFVNIVSSLPTSIGQTLELAADGRSQPGRWGCPHVHRLFGDDCRHRLCPRRHPPHSHSLRAAPGRSPDEHGTQQLSTPAPQPRRRNAHYFRLGCTPPCRNLSPISPKMNTRFNSPPICAPMVQPPGCM